MLSIAFIAVGGLLLIFSAHYLVINAVAVARLVNVPPLLISLTVVAFGTSAPELVVSIDAILAYHPDIVMGNIIGSNIANVLVVLALAAIISPVSMPYHGIKSESLWMAGVTGLFALLCFTGLIAWWHGVIMVLGLVVFSYVSYRRMRADGDDADALLEEFESPESGGNSAGGKSGGLGVKVLVIIVALALLALGAELFVRGAVGVSRLLNVPEAVIALSVVALGSAAPEIVTAVVAAWHRHGDIALGNVIGSNIFNLLGIMGVTALVSPIPVDRHFLEVDIFVLLATTLLLTGLCWWGRAIGRLTGCAMVLAYGAYVVFIFIG